MKINRIITFGVFVLISLQMFAQETTEPKPEKTPFLGFKDNRDVYFQLLVGTGYSFYKMKGEEKIIQDFKGLGYNVGEMSGRIQFNIGMSILLKQPEIRFLFDYRHDGYSNKSPVYINLSFFGSETKTMELVHDITTVSIGLEKLFFLSEEKNSYLGLGGAYLWINDDRNDNGKHQIGSVTKDFNTTIGINAKALQIQASMGSLLSGKLFVEGKLGYQFEQAIEIESQKNLPGLSTDGFKPNFNTFSIKFLFGVIL